MEYYKPIAESKTFIVLGRYTREWTVSETGAGYQTESDLEQEFIGDLQNQGYEFMPDIKSPASMLANVRAQLQSLNSAIFSEGEWFRFVEEFLDKPSDGIVDKTRKVHDNCGSGTTGVYGAANRGFYHYSRYRKLEILMK
jgi:type I restriction enzyme R subunit